MLDVTAPTPQGAPTPTPAAPPAVPPVTTPPVPAPPVTPPAQGAPAAGQPGDDQQLVRMTQDRFNTLFTERLDRAKQTWQQEQAQAETERNKALAAMLGITDPNATPDPAELLKQAQTQAAAAQQRADAAEAKALALAAGVKPERLDLFMRLADVGGALANVDRSKPEAAVTALKSAVDAALVAAPEFKGTALPASSGGDGQHGATPSLDQLIATAEAAGDWKSAISLKRKKAEQRNGG